MKSNPEIIKLREEFKKLWLSSKKDLWKRIFDDLSKPTRKMAVVNVGKINKFANENETVVVVGKVLGGYDISKPITVVALGFSNAAKDKISKAKGKAILLKDFVKKPVTKVRLMR